MSPAVELLLEPSQDSIIKAKNLPASEYKQESKEEMQQQKQTTSSFNIKSMLNPVPSPSYKSSLSKASTIGYQVQQETQTHQALPSASSITQKSFFSSGQTPLNLRLPPPYPSLSPPPTFSSTNFSYDYTYHKQGFPFNNVTNVTPLSQASTGSSTSIAIANTPTTIQSSHSLVLNNNITQNTPSTNYDTSPTTATPSISSTLNGRKTEVIPMAVSDNSYHNLDKNSNSSNISTSVDVTTVRKMSIPSVDSSGLQFKDLSNSIEKYATKPVQEVEYTGYSPPHPATKHKIMEMEVEEEETYFASGLDQLASTALNELQNMRRKEMEMSETGSGEEVNFPSDQELAASPFVERSFTPIKTFVSPSSYESTTGSTPAHPQTDSEFPQYEYDDHEAVLFGETTETESDNNSLVEETETTTNKATVKRIVKKSKSKKSLKKNKGKGKERQTKSRKYKIKREGPEIVSSDDDKLRKRKPTTKRPRSAPLKRKATSQLVHGNSKNKRLKKSTSPQSRSRTTSNSSSVNNSPLLRPQAETTITTIVVDDMAIDEVEKKVQLYCICRSSDGESFMIECDNCDEWFHGECVSISREESQMVDKYYCPNCTELGFKTSWKPEKCKYPPCKKPARLVKLKFCSVKCGLSWNRELLKREDKLAKMGKLLKPKFKDNKDKKGRIKRNVTNRSGQLEDSEHLKKISSRKNSIKKELEIIDKRNKITVRSTEKSQSDSEQDDSDGSTQDVPCELDKQPGGDGNIRNGQICGYNTLLDWIDNDVNEKIESAEEVCTAPKGKCKKHAGWQKRRSNQIELMKANKVEKLDELSEQEKLIRARRKKRTDMSGAFTNQTIDYTASKKKSN